MFTLILRHIILFLLLFFSISAKAIEPKVDFNGDGIADIFLQNIFTGEVSAWLIGGSGVLNSVSYGKIDPSTGWVMLGLSDFNGDGRTDVLWRNGLTGEIDVWLINGSHILQQAKINSVAPNSGWLPVDIKDFNGDGRSDLLWRNTSSGALNLWCINGSNIILNATIGTVNPTSGWAPIDSKDFNGDGRSDLLWRNSNTGGIIIWLLDGSRTLQSSLLTTVNPTSGWAPIDSKDFNGDGRSDLLFSNSNTGQLMVALISGTSFLSTGSIGTVATNSGLNLINISDFNNDNKFDLLFYNNINGEYSTWLINGINVLSKRVVGKVDPSSNSGLVSVGFDDFNGDGKIDILWRNVYSNNTLAWLMNGSGLPQIKNYNSVPPSSVWQVTIPQ